MDDFRNQASPVVVDPSGVASSEASKAGGCGKRGHGGGRISSGLAVFFWGTNRPPPKPKRGSTVIDYDAKICQVLQDFLPTSAPWTWETGLRDRSFHFGQVRREVDCNAIASFKCLIIVLVMVLAACHRSNTLSGILEYEFLQLRTLVFLQRSQWCTWWTCTVWHAAQSQGIVGTVMK